MTRRNPRRRAAQPGVERIEARRLLAALPPGGLAIDFSDVASRLRNPIRGADLLTQQRVGPARPFVGSDLPVFVTVTNRGPLTATDVRLVNPTPAGTELAGATAPVGGTAVVDASGVTFRIGDLAPGQTVTAIVVLRPTRVGVFVNAAGATSDVNDPNPAAALSALRVPVLSRTPVDFAGPAVFAGLRYGAHGFPTQLSVSFADALDPTTAALASNYQVFRVATDPETGRPVDLPVPIVGVTYRPTSRAVILRTPFEFPARTEFRVVINTEGPTGVRAADGTPIESGVAVATVSPRFIRGKLPVGFPAIPFRGGPTTFHRKIRSLP